MRLTLAHGATSALVHALFNVTLTRVPVVFQIRARVVLATEVPWTAPGHTTLH